MKNEHDLLSGFETHAAEEVRAALANGVDPNATIDGKPAVWRLIEMYTRSSRFSECLRVMLDAGATVGDPLLEAILLDDADALRRLLAAAPDETRRTIHMDCAYTLLDGVSPLHVCAEYNGTACARVLLDAGVDVNVRADVDANGMGGQTPIFHAVNSSRNHCRPMMELLVDAGADLDIRLDGLIWGRGCEWETAVFDVTPISYAQCGLYPQFHRREQDVYANIAYLHGKKHARDPHLPNVPNRYVTDDFDLAAARRGRTPESGSGSP